MAAIKSCAEKASEEKGWGHWSLVLLTESAGKIGAVQGEEKECCPSNKVNGNSGTFWRVTCRTPKDRIRKG
ncbi:hypothetical protein GCM10010924_07670 [Rhizobium wenxiniae]|nr:hypothetical protein GCM10010924_07670 [Rhizobium wenxiniae]